MKVHPTPETIKTNNQYFIYKQTFGKKKKFIYKSQEYISKEDLKIWR